ncbi:MAG: hypothetical protein KGM17_01230 [Sphingomonadales bacterium]|nr:hypothetical protein [Sphingomonadales bacterium]
MRKAVVVLALLAAACGKKEEAAGPAEVAKQEAGPNVGVNAAPGIAVSYDYAFRLAAEKVAAMQEQHASACEALGPATCRVAGMTYEVSRQRWVTGTLELRLAPGAARKFGKGAIDAVVQGGGMLASARIESENAGATIAQAAANGASYADDKARIEKQLAQPGLGSTERSQLQAQLAALADAGREVKVAAATEAARLASTPVMLRYESGEVDESLSDGPIVGAVKDGWRNIIWGFTFLLWAAVSVVPWVIGGGALSWGWRWWRRRAPGGEKA